jgi:hypothetical protein
MGSILEFNDTLQLTTEQGFPADLFDLQRHRTKPITLDDVQGRVFTFENKTGPRFFHLDPVRVYWFHNINDLWLAWGQILVHSQTISRNPNPPPHQGPPNVSDPQQWVTSGEYTALKIYDPAYQELVTRNETPPGLSYFSAPGPVTP